MTEPTKDAAVTAVAAALRTSGIAQHHDGTEWGDAATDYAAKMLLECFAADPAALATVADWIGVHSGRAGTRLRPRSKGRTMTTPDALRAALERAWNVGLRGEFIRLVSAVLPSFDDEGNAAGDVAEGMADHFESAYVRAALGPQARTSPEVASTQDAAGEAGHWAEFTVSPLTCSHDEGWIGGADDSTWCVLCGRWRDDIMCAATPSVRHETEDGLRAALTQAIRDAEFAMRSISHPVEIVAKQRQIDALERARAALSEERA